MTFTDKEIEDEKITVSYDDEWEYDDEHKTINVKFCGFEDRLRKFFNLKDDYGDDWIDCYATINPVEDVVTEIYMEFISNCDVPDRELYLKITNCTEGKMLLSELLENDTQVGVFIKFYKDSKEEYLKEV